MEESGGSSSDDGKTFHRGHWRPAEDEKLRQLVDRLGARNWNTIAEKIEGRSGKSCRLRWYNQINPHINKMPFTGQEEERLLEAQRKYGNRWSLIACFFPGRTDNAVKNHYHVIMARQQRNHQHPKPTNRNPSASGNLGGFPMGSCINDWSSYGMDHCFHASYRGFRASQRRTPNFERVDPIYSFGLSNILDNKTYGYSAAIFPDLPMAPRQQGDDESMKHKDVPFIDFLGVGTSSSS